MRIFANIATKRLNQDATKIHILLYLLAHLRADLETVLIPVVRTGENNFDLFWFVLQKEVTAHYRLFICLTESRFAACKSVMFSEWLKYSTVNIEESLKSCGSPLKDKNLWIYSYVYKNLWMMEVAICKTPALTISQMGAAVGCNAYLVA